MRDDETTTTPALTLSPTDINGFQLSAEATDLYAEPCIKVTAPDGSEIRVPSRFVYALDRGASTALNRMSSMRNDACLQENLPTLIEPSLVRLEPGAKFVRPGEDAAAEGVPLLQWWRRTSFNQREHTDRDCGWSLVLTGPETVELGYAEWHDRAAIANLIDAMSDVDMLISMAGIIAPDVVARLHARRAAVSLRSRRALPAIAIPPVRKILTDAGLIAADTAGRWSGGRLRVLPVRVGDTKVPVAVAIACPQVPHFLDESADQASNHESYAVYNAAREKAREEARAEWSARAKAAFAAQTKWRLIDLPDPRRAYYRDNAPLLWVTRIDATTWQDLSAAATAAARELEMSRGASFA